MRSLSTLSNAQSELGLAEDALWTTEALEAVEEALRIARGVAENEPTLVERTLRIALETRAGLLRTPEPG